MVIWIISAFIVGALAGYLVCMLGHRSSTPIDDQVKQNKPSNPKGKNPFMYDGKPVEIHAPLDKDLLVKDLSEADSESPFYDKRVVITGVFHIERNELARVLKVKMGADINGSISGKTDFLLAGDAPGPSKMDKAKELNTTVIYEDELMPMIEKYL